MSKRTLMMSLAVGLGIAMLAGTAEAGNWSFIQPPGMWWYYGSVDGCAAIGHVPNPLHKPAAVECTVVVEESEAICVNPQYHNVLPGEAANKVITMAEPISPEDMSLSKKEKGVASTCLTLEDEVFGVECELKNWHPQVLVTQFKSTCSTKQCLGTDNPDTLDVNEACNTLGEEEDTQICRCYLDGASLDAPPDPGTAYRCDELDSEGQLTGRTCQLPE